MKKLILSALCFSVAAAGCTKDNGFGINNKQLTGKWELAQSSGGFAGITKEYAPGNGNTISFTATSFTTVAVYADTTYNFQGSYTIYKGKPCDFAPETTLIHFKISCNYEYENGIMFANGGLEIEPPPCTADGITYFYRKIE